MQTPSLLELLERLEGYQSMLDIADRMLQFGKEVGFEHRVWAEYILRNVLWFSDQEIDMLTSTMTVPTDDEEGDGDFDMSAGPMELGGGEESAPSDLTVPGEPEELGGGGEIAPEEISAPESHIKALTKLIMERQITNSKNGNGHNKNYHDMG